MANAKFTVYLFSEDARAQAKFYTDALGGEIKQLQTFGELPQTPEALKDKVLHMHFVAAGVDFLMSDRTPGTYIDGNTINLSLEFAGEADAHSAFNNLAAGGTVESPLKLEFWGALFGKLQDKYGVNWMISTTAPQH